MKKSQVFRILFLFLLICLVSGCNSKQDDIVDTDVKSTKNNNSLPTEKNYDEINLSETNSIMQESETIPTQSYIRGLTATDDGEIFYATEECIYKVAKDRTESIFNNSHDQYDNLLYVQGMIYALVKEDGWKLLKFDENGMELDSFKVDMPDNTMVSTIVHIKGTNKLCITTLVDSIDQGYLCDFVNKTTMAINYTSKYNELFYLSAFSNGSMILSRWNDNSVLVTLKGDALEDKESDVYYSIDQYYEDYYTGKIYNVSASGIINLLDFQSGAQSTLIKVENELIIYPCLVNGIMYYTNGDKNIKTINVATLEQNETDKIELNILVYDGQNFSNSTLSTYIDYFVSKYPNVNVKRTEISQEYKYNSSQMLVELMSGESNTDIIFVSDYEVKNLVDAGIVMDLSEFDTLTSVFENENLLEGVDKICTVDNMIVGIPYEYVIPAYVCNAEVFSKYNIPIPNPVWSLDEYYKLAKDYCKDYDGDGAIDVYLNANRPELFNISTGVGLNVLNNYKFDFSSPEFINYMKKSMELKEMKVIYPYTDEVYFTWAERNNFDDKWMNTLFSNINFPHEYSIYPSNAENPYFLENHPPISSLDNLSLVNYPIPTDIKNGSSMGVQLMSVLGSSQNAELAALFLAEFMDEDYQRETSKEMLLYKDISKYKELSILPDEYERFTTECIKNYVNVYIIPTLDYWMNVELFPLFESTNMSIEDAAKLIQKEAKKRIDG